MKKILLGAVIGTLITALFFTKFQSSPGPVKVSEKPTGKEELVITEKKAGQLISRVPVTPTPLAPGKTAQNVLELAVGSQYSALANGEVKTIYLDRSGRKVGEGFHPITGETKVTVGPEWLDIRTKFQDTLTVAVDLPALPLKQNELGAFYNGEVVFYYQRDLMNLKIGKFELLGWAGLSYRLAANGLSISTGLATRF